MLVMGAWLYENGISRPVRKRLVKIFGSHRPSFLRWIKKQDKESTNKKKQEETDKKDKNKKRLITG